MMDASACTCTMDVRRYALACLLCSSQESRLTPQQHAIVSQPQICLDSCMCSHTEVEVADENSYLTQSQYADTRSRSPSADAIMSGAWQGGHWSVSL